MKVILSFFFLQNFLTHLFKFTEIKDFYETLEVGLRSISCRSDVVTYTVQHLSPRTSIDPFRPLTF